MICKDCKYYYTFNKIGFYDYTQHRCQVHGYNYSYEVRPEQLCILSKAEFEKAVQKAPYHDHKSLFNNSNFS